AGVLLRHERQQSAREDAGHDGEDGYAHGGRTFDASRHPRKGGSAERFTHPRKPEPRGGSPGRPRLSSKAGGLLPASATLLPALSRADARAPSDNQTAW